MGELAGRFTEQPQRLDQIEVVEFRRMRIEEQREVPWQVPHAESRHSGEAGSSFPLPCESGPRRQRSTREPQPIQPTASQRLVANRNPLRQRDDRLVVGHHRASRQQLFELNQRDA